MSLKPLALRALMIVGGLLVIHGMSRCLGPQVLLLDDGCRQYLVYESDYGQSNNRYNMSVTNSHVAPNQSCGDPQIADVYRLDPWEQWCLVPYEHR
jgi:hypothetical protein